MGNSVNVIVTSMMARTLIAKLGLVKPYFGANEEAILDRDDDEVELAGMEDEEQGHAEKRRLSGCNWEKDCIWAPMQMTKQSYEAIQREHSKFGALPNSGVFAFVVGAHMLGDLRNSGMWGLPWGYDALCIVPGDFTGDMSSQQVQQQQYCRGQKYFREIEKERSSCKCVHGGDTHCLKWKCHEISTGIFEVLFEDPLPNIADLLVGIEMEDWQCVKSDQTSCQAWEGTSTSWKAAEMAHCDCSQTTDEMCVQWICDEYKVYVQHPWYWYPQFYLTFGILHWLLVGQMAMKSNFVLALATFALHLVFSACVFSAIGLWGFLFVSLAPIVASLIVCKASGSAKYENLVSAESESTSDVSTE